MKFLSLITTSLLPLTLLAARYNGYNSPYSFDSNYYHAPKWMTAFPDSTNLTSLSIPGTHDTMTSAINGPIFQCQNHHLSTLLESGIRYLDIRARLVNNTLQIYHGDQFTQHSYPSVLLSLYTFLATNPSETILMRLKEESSPINSTLSFLTLFDYYRLLSPDTAPGWAQHVYTPETVPIAKVPVLGELRGKILILQNFGTEEGEFGIKWESPLLSIQDEYDIPDLYAGLDYKFQAVQDGLLAAQKGIGEGDGKLYLGHLSASVGVLPIEAAAGDKAADGRGGRGEVVGINDRTGDWLARGMGGRTGVVIMDFPGRELVKGVLGRN